MSKFISLDDLFDDSPSSSVAAPTTAVVEVVEQGEPMLDPSEQPINVLADPPQMQDEPDGSIDASFEVVNTDQETPDEAEQAAEVLAGIPEPEPTVDESKLTPSQKREKLISEIFEQNNYIVVCEGEVESAKETLKDAKDQLEKATSRLRVLVRSLQTFGEKENLPLFDGLTDEVDGEDSIDDEDQPTEQQSIDVTIKIESESESDGATMVVPDDVGVVYEDVSDEESVGSNAETLQSILDCSAVQIAKFTAAGYHTIEDLIVALKHDSEQENIDVLTQVEGVGKAKAKKYLEIISARKANS